MMLYCEDRRGVLGPNRPSDHDDDGASTMAKSYPIRADLTAEYVRSILDYDPETGVFTWKPRSDAPPKWRGRWTGKMAGGPNYEGYWRISIKSRRYASHRLAWLWFYGSWPSGPLDHADGDRGNNRIANLRVATPSENNANVPRPKTNTSGRKGVMWDKEAQRWRAYIRYRHRCKHLGYFDCIDDAHAAYAAAAIEQWGEFARIDR